MPTKRTEPLPTVPCSNCAGPVMQTRRSQTGLHFCSDGECQKAKGRALYKSRVRTQANIEKEAVVQLVHALANSERKPCPECGLANALPGYKHPARDGQVCLGVGSTGLGALSMFLVPAIWPYGQRSYAPMD